MSNPFYDQIILDRYQGKIDDIDFSGNAQNVMKFYTDKMGYKLINTWDFPTSGNSMPMYDFITLYNSGIQLYNNVYWTLAFEYITSDDESNTEVYKSVIRHYKLQNDGSIWVKQYVYINNNSIFDLSPEYRKSLCNLPDENEFNLYYSGIYQMILAPNPSIDGTPTPYVPIPCNIVGCLFKSEQDFFITTYNNFPKVNLSLQELTDKANLESAYYMLTYSQITSAYRGYNIKYVPYATGSGERQQNYSMLHEVANLQEIKATETVINNTNVQGDFNPNYIPNDTSGSPDLSNQTDPYGNGQTGYGNGQTDPYIENTHNGVDNSYQTYDPYNDSFGTDKDAQVQYGNPDIVDIVEPDTMMSYQNPINISQISPENKIEKKETPECIEYTQNVYCLIL